ncbi:MAG: nicotinate-nucleotide--dimethylbenzimidazole phosphoribosyltransferase [Lachnospiraceae bacterium]|nr:nicotinate-nucleotide--dimethylbenzimidazole phosphoribosyltransferase [Lachnospiraceae bacterium]
MTKQELFELKIDPVDDAIYQSVKENWDAHSKPIDGFGDFEDAICRIAAASGTKELEISRRAAVIMIADNGIVEEGISQSSKEITRSVAKNLGDGISTVSVLGASAKVDIVPVDIGMDCEERILGVQDRKVRCGTRNFLKEPAMTEEEVLLAISHGIDLVKNLREQRYTILATGEMGIGNTTTSTALLCAILGLDPKDVTGRGAGLSDAGLLHKQEVIQKGLSRYASVLEAASTLDGSHVDGGREVILQMLRCLGGLDIAGLVGICIGGAIYHVPIVLDGLISSVSALVAERICPGVKDYMLASHKGREGGNALVLEELGLPYYIHGDMALGEGTGAVLLFSLLDTILYYYKHGSSFTKTRIEAYKRFES